MGGEGSGRRPKPPALKLLTGRGPGKDSAGRPIELPPPFTRGAPVCPDWLGEYAREVWAAHLPVLVRLRLTKPEDVAALAAYCEAVEQFRDATLDIREHGLILECVKAGVRFIAPTDPGFDPGAGENRGYFVPYPMIERKPNPAVAVQNAAAMRVKTFALQFGFTPASEGSLLLAAKDRGGVDGDDGPSPFAATS